jgi:alkyldihydroxyacetonephosphate synthase
MKRSWAPTPPIEWGAPLGELEDVWSEPATAVGAELVSLLQASGAEVLTDEAALAEASRDWWPLSLRWALHGRAPRRPAIVVRPSDVSQVAAVLRAAGSHRVPVTPAGGRSGVTGGAVPRYGGIALDCCRLAGITAVDEQSLRVEVLAGTPGAELEAELRARHKLTVGHFPQSMDLATVGGWVACRGAGQYSTRYGKIEDIVAGLEVVLADGTTVRTGALAGAGPRSATGPDLTQLFVGSEGTLGVITRVLLRAHPLPEHELRAAYSFSDFETGLEALRRTLARGATPAVLRLYDEAETRRNFEIEKGCLLIALDEGAAPLVEATMGLLEKAARENRAEPLPAELVGRWLEQRNDVSALAPLTRAGIVVDTIEVAAPWSKLALLAREMLVALRAVEGSLSCSVHQSHAYLDGACLYFTFAGRGEDPQDDRWAEAFYQASWQVGMEACLKNGASISHHHGIGLVRGPFMRQALGEGFAVLEALKEALDPAGILNPGKLGLPAAPKEA